MKKIAALILALLMVFSFTACKKDKAKKNAEKHSVNIEEYAKKGKIPEIKYSLGQDVEVLLSALEADAEEQGLELDDAYNIYEGEDKVLISAGGYEFYYFSDNEDKGISYIVSYQDAYGFTHDITLINEVEKVLSNYKYKKEDITDKNAFFMMGVSEGTVLSAEFGKNTVSFVFVDNALSATAIYKTQDWK